MSQFLRNLLIRCCEWMRCHSQTEDWREHQVGGELVYLRRDNGAGADDVQTVETTSTTDTETEACWNLDKQTKMGKDARESKATAIEPVWKNTDRKANAGEYFTISEEVWYETTV